MSTQLERVYIGKLMEELRRDFDKLAKEYQQERDLGALGEFANLYRKARKLKTLMWPGENAHPNEAWREDLRTIVKEIVSHGLLLLTDLDKVSGSFDEWKFAYAESSDDEYDEELLSAKELEESKHTIFRQAAERRRQASLAMATPPPTRRLDEGSHRWVRLTTPV